ncbi:Hypothetical protein, putative [Bodo saltans]|uniref:Uncharacterized protein n=1 Tax=Bodo saltans TaxID=75058 RepID=A0A0S4JSS3_BODSA|nr:Hypothetical protein, putative [Bodo saltans]|eukprot:CUG93285.1 Hypothetical protein, putative [Bodo saltans]
MDKWSVASEGGAIGIPGGNNSHREQHLIDKERGIVGSTLTPFMNTLLPHGPSSTEEVGLPLIAIPVPQMSLLTSHHAPPGTSDVHTIQSRRLMPSRQGERNDQRHKQPLQSPRMRTQ